MLGMMLLGLGTAACGGGDGEAAEARSAAFLGTCGVRAEIGGGAEIRFTGKDDVACGTQHSFDTGLDGVFIGVNAQGSLELAIAEVAEGETGEDFPTRVTVTTSGAKERWQGSSCLTSISEHRLVKAEDSEIGELRHYQVGGTGGCAEDLVSAQAGNAGLTLGTFEFRAEFTWRD
jgi:hypothetical protein